MMSSALVWLTLSPLIYVRTLRLIHTACLAAHSVWGGIIAEQGLKNLFFLKKAQWAGLFLKTRVFFKKTRAFKKSQLSGFGGRFIAF